MRFNKTFITGGDINYLPLIEVLKYNLAKPNLRNEQPQS